MELIDVKVEWTAILDAGNVAPTAKNNQPQRTYVIQSEDALAKARTLTPCTYKASTVLLFTYNKDEVFLYPGAEMVSSGACFVLQIRESSSSVFPTKQYLSEKST